jgi:hypothetical protein
MVDSILTVKDLMDELAGSIAQGPALELASAR